MRNVRVKGQTVAVAYSTYVDVPDSVVQVAEDGTVWFGAIEGVVRGAPIGRVVKGTREWERRSPGARYVNARGTTPEWHGYAAGGRGWRPDVRADTRGETIAKLIAQHLHRQGKSREVRC